MITLTVIVTIILFALLALLMCLLTGGFTGILIVADIVLCIVFVGFCFKAIFRK